MVSFSYFCSKRMTCATDQNCIYAQDIQGRGLKEAKCFGGRADVCKEVSVLFTSTELAAFVFCLSLFVPFVAVCPIVLQNTKEGEARLWPLLPLHLFFWEDCLLSFRKIPPDIQSCNSSFLPGFLH